MSVPQAAPPQDFVPRPEFASAIAGVHARLDAIQKEQSGAHREVMEKLASLSVFDERQKALTAIQLEHAKAIIDLKSEDIRIERKVDMWINRGWGAYAVLGIILTVLGVIFGVGHHG